MKLRIKYNSLDKTSKNRDKSGLLMGKGKSLFNLLTLFYSLIKLKLRFLSCIGQQQKRGKKDAF